MNYFKTLAFVVLVAFLTGCGTPGMVRVHRDENNSEKIVALAVRYELGSFDVISRKLSANKYSSLYPALLEERFVSLGLKNGLKVVSVSPINTVTKPVEASASHLLKISAKKAITTSTATGVTIYFDASLVEAISRKTVWSAEGASLTSVADNDKAILYVDEFVASFLNRLSKDQFIVLLQPKAVNLEGNTISRFDTLERAPDRLR